MATGTAGVKSHRGSRSGRLKKFSVFSSPFIPLDLFEIWGGLTARVAHGEIALQISFVGMRGHRGLAQILARGLAERPSADRTRTFNAATFDEDVVIGIVSHN